MHLDVAVHIPGPHRERRSFEELDKIARGRHAVGGGELEDTLEILVFLFLLLATEPLLVFLLRLLADQGHFGLAVPELMRTWLTVLGHGVNPL